MRGPGESPWDVILRLPGHQAPARPKVAAQGVCPLGNSEPRKGGSLMRRPLRGDKAGALDVLNKASSLRISAMISSTLWTRLRHWNCSAKATESARSDRSTEVVCRRWLTRRLRSSLIGRLAVAKHRQGQGLGAILLADALQRAFDSTSTVGASMVIVDALDERAVDFYAAHGLVRLPELAAPRAAYAYCRRDT